MLTNRRHTDQKLNLLTSNAMEGLVVPRPVNRITYLASLCAGKRVLDLGAYDETEVKKSQHKSWKWLHSELAEVATDILGVDASNDLIDKREITTQAGSRIIYGAVNDLTEIVEKFDPDIVVAGELIEHTPDSLLWLRKLSGQIPGKEILITTPNTTSIINIALALFDRENAHVDHLHVYSYKTLACLSRQLGLNEARITPYYYRTHLFRSKIHPALRPLVYFADYGVVGPIQWHFPLYSGGLILHGRFGA